MSKIWWGLFAVCVSSAAQAETRMVRVSELKVSQSEFGRANIGPMMRPVRKDAKAARLSMLNYVRGPLKLKMAAGKAFPAVIDPDGHVVITDGHHRGYLLSRLERTAQAGLEVPVDIKHDYSGWAHADYASHFVNVLGKGQFAHDQNHLPVQDKMKALPKSLLHMKNNPMRAIVGASLYELGVDSGHMVDYVEFKLIPKLMERGYVDQLKARGLMRADEREIPARLARDPAALGIAKSILKDRAMRPFVLTQVRSDEHRNTIDEALSK